MIWVHAPWLRASESYDSPHMIVVLLQTMSLGLQFRHVVHMLQTGPIWSPCF